MWIWEQDALYCRLLLPVHRIILQVCGLSKTACTTICEIDEKILFACGYQIVEETVQMPFKMEKANHNVPTFPL